MTKSFFEIFSETKKTYQPSSELPIFEIIFYLSKKVKSKTDFLEKSHEKIDFSNRHFKKLIKNYFQNQKPLAHIIGKTVFFSREFVVCKKILAPRPETELLVERAVDLINSDKKLLSAIDICCGTGNIGISLKKEIPELEVSLLDINTKAIKNAKINCQLLGADVKLINKNYFTFLSKPTKHDIIVCNPPYVRATELNKKMLKYESKISFINSQNATDFYRSILGNIEKLVRDPNHFIVCFEICSSIKPDLLKVVDEVGLSQYSKWFKDYANQDRVLVVYKKQG